MSNKQKNEAVIDMQIKGGSFKWVEHSQNVY
jgi:hypothetical protein